MRSPPHRILVAVDGSPTSLRAGSLAIDFAASWGAQIRAVAVLGEDRAERLVDEGRPGTTPARERRRAALEDAVEHLVRAGKDAGVPVEPAVRVRPRAQPYEVILDEAERWHADMLIVGRGSHRGLGRALLGSQTEHVLEFATLPVIVVPAKSGIAR